jgi:hypothetical protein
MPITDFNGVSLFRYNGNGIYKIKWTIYEDPSVKYYRIYIRKDSSDVFHNQYLLTKVSSDYDEYFIRTEANGITLLNPSYTYFVGIKIEDISGDIDLNTISKTTKSVNDLTFPLEIPDRKVKKAI